MGSICLGIALEREVNQYFTSFFSAFENNLDFGTVSNYKFYLFISMCIKISTFSKEILPKLNDMFLILAFSHIQNHEMFLISLIIQINTVLITVN